MRMSWIAVLAVAVAASAAGQTAAYDAFMQQGVEQRHAQFRTFSPEQRADIVRTHLRRYLARHRARLTPAQAAFLAETASRMSADFHRSPLSAEARQALGEIEQRGRELFPPKDGRQVLTLDGDYIPPTPEP